MKKITMLTATLAVDTILSVVPILGVQASTDTYKSTTSQNISQVTTVKRAQGWVKEADGFWRYGNADGTAKTGWFQDNGTWYYLYKVYDGGMASNCYVGTYKISESGAWVQNAPVPSTIQGKFGTEYLGESSETLFTNSYIVPLRIMDDLLSQGKLAKGTYYNSNVGQTSDWYFSTKD